MPYDFQGASITHHLILKAAVGDAVLKTNAQHQQWQRPGYFGLVKQAVNDNKLSGQFYELYIGGQEGSIIFLNFVGGHCNI